MKLEVLISVLEEVSVFGQTNVDIQDIAYHTSQVKPGSCFVAIRGISSDGHAFINDAIQKGAKVIVSEKPVPVSKGITNVVVSDTRDALARLSAELFDNPSLKMKLVGVTGTNGKTTITYLLEKIFEAAGLQAGVIGTVDYRFGGNVRSAPHTTPESYDLQKLLSEMYNAGTDACAMEVSSHALDMGRVVGCHFDGAIFTNLTPEHLDYHGNMDEYFQSKERLFRERLVASVKPRAFAAVNVDDPFGRKLLSSINVPLYRYGLDEKADVTCRLFKSDEEGLRLVVQTPKGEIKIKSSLKGKFNALNILASISAGLGLGIDLDSMRQGIESVERVPGRFDSVPNDRGIFAIVDYAHTPDALYNVLVYAKELAKSRLIVVFGCGGDRDPIKRPLMGEVVAKIADVAIVTNDNPRTEDPQKIIDMIVPGLKEGGMNQVSSGDDRGYIVMPDRRDAILNAVKIAKKGDVLVVAGKGHENYQIIGTQRKHFDDREELGEALKIS